MRKGKKIKLSMEMYRFHSNQKDSSTRNRDDCIAYMKYYEGEAKRHKENAIMFSNNADFYKNELERLGVKTL